MIMFKDDKVFFPLRKKPISKLGKVLAITGRFFIYFVELLTLFISGIADVGYIIVAPK